MENQHVSEELSDWEQIHSPFSTITSELINDENPIVVKDNFFSEPSVFPPVNHENLPVTINPQDNDHQHLQEDDDGGVGRWKRPCLGVLKIRIFEFAESVRKYVTCKVGLWSFAWTASGVAGLVMVYFLHRRVLIWWQRRMQIESGKESLMNLIREKDKKINQLLLQIAQMNEILLARRTVPVIRVK
ncbi:hypothetical protein DH2020_032384 [Rehmannia glutinosa]|uniref:Transmembrane protein n=1 Tax=Rehmannia glutinosa TaxID=99300 RepID=A0ABR0VIA0_REHGL